MYPICSVFARWQWVIFDCDGKYLAILFLTRSFTTKGYQLANDSPESLAGDSRSSHRWIMKTRPYSTMTALWAIRILRRLPHSADFDCHLTDCAAIAVFYGEDGASEQLRLAHVLRIARMPQLLLSLNQRAPEGVNIASLAGNRVTRSLEDPELFSGAETINYGSKAVH